MRGIYIPEHSCNAHPRTSEAIYDLLVINIGVLDSQVGIMPISITRYIFNGLGVELGGLDNRCAFRKEKDGVASCIPSDDHLVAYVTV